MTVTDVCFAQVLMTYTTFADFVNKPCGVLAVRVGYIRFSILSLVKTTVRNGFRRKTHFWDLLAHRVGKPRHQSGCPRSTAIAITMHWGAAVRSRICASALLVYLNRHVSDFIRTFATHNIFHCC